MRGLIAVTETITELDPSLEIVQLSQKEREADQTGDYDKLHFEIERDIEVEQEISSSEETPAVKDESPSPDASTPAEETDPFAEADSDAEAEKDKPADDIDAPEDEDPKEAPSKTEVEVRESISTDSYDRVYATEGFFDALSALAVKTYEILRDTLVWLGFTAVPFLWAKTRVAMKYISASVFWLFGKSVRLAMKTGIMIVERYKRFKHSLAKRQREIKSLREALVLMKARAEVYTKPEGTPEPMYRDQKIIQWFSLAGKVSPLASTSAVARFTEVVVDSLNRSLMKDLQDLRNLLSYNQHSVQGDILHILRVQPSMAVFMKRSVQGYSNHQDLVDTYVYNGKLPNNFIFIANLPRTELRDVETVSSAYGKSGMMFGISNDVNLPPEEIPCLTFNEAVKVLDELEKLCDLVAKQATFYKNADSQINGLKTNYRHYYESLLATEERKTMHDTMVEYIYMKQSFCGNVYIPAIMDVHDFMNDYITHTLRYVKASIKARR